MLNIENFSVTLKQQPILTEISFNLQKGKILGLIGPNGAGKTTLIRAINGSISTHEGKILFDEEDLTSLDFPERARYITTVSQNRAIPAGFSVRQIVLMGRTPYLNWFGKVTEKDEEIAEEAMRRTDTLHLANVMADELSGGEQQRVILARSFAQATPLLLLDEPTTHLDIRFQMQFLDVLLQQAWGKGVAVIIAMHDLNQALHFCDEVLLLNQGRVYASGKPEHVLSAENLSAVYQYPIKVKYSHESMPLFIYPRLDLTKKRAQWVKKG